MVRDQAQGGVIVTIRRVTGVPRVPEFSYPSSFLSIPQLVGKGKEGERGRQKKGVRESLVPLVPIQPRNGGTSPSAPPQFESPIEGGTND